MPLSIRDNRPSGHPACAQIAIDLFRHRNDMIEAPHGPLVEVFERFEFHRLAIPRVARGEARQPPRHAQSCKQYVGLVSVRMHDGTGFAREHTSKSAQHGPNAKTARRHVRLGRNSQLRRAAYQLAVALQCDDSAVPPLIAQKHRELEQGPLGAVESPSADELNRHRRATSVALHAVALRHSRISCVR